MKGRFLLASEKGVLFDSHIQEVPIWKSGHLLGHTRNCPFFPLQQNCDRQKVGCPAVYMTGGSVAPWGAPLPPLHGARVARGQRWDKRSKRRMSHPEGGLENEGPDREERGDLAF